MNLQKIEKQTVLEYMFEKKISTFIRSQLKINNFYVIVKVILDKNKPIKSISDSILPDINPAPVQENKKNEFKIDHLEINVVLDDTISTNMDELVKMAVKQSIPFRASRGDFIKINHQNLSYKNSLLQNLNHLLKNQKAFENNISNKLSLLTNDLNNQKEDLKKVREDIKEKFKNIRNELNQNINKTKTSLENEIDKTETKLNTKIDDTKEKLQVQIDNLSKDISSIQDILKNLNIDNNLYYWLVASVIILLIIILLLYLFLKSSINASKTELNSKIDSFTHIIDRLEKKISELKKFNKQKERELKLKEFEEKLVEMVRNDKTNIKKFIKNNIISREGKEKIALIIKLLGYKEFASIFNSDDETLYKKILNSVKDIKIRDEELIEKVENLYSDLIAMYEYKRSVNEGYFKFLENLTKDEILDLIEDEPMLVKIIVLSSVDEHLSTSIIEEMNTDEKLEIIMNLSKLDKIPLSEIKEISQKLFEKYKKYLEIKAIKISEESQMIDMIRMLNPNEQKEILNQIKEKDNNLYNIIKNKTFIFDDILKLDNNKLKSLISQFEVEELAVLFSDFDETIKNKINSILGSRKLAILMDNIENNEYSEELKKEVRQKFLSIATNFIKKK